MRKKLESHGLKAQVLSMGTLGIVGRGADPKMIHVGRELYGLDLTSHRSQGVSLALLKFSDIAFIMDDAQEQMLMRYSPQTMNKIKRLGVFLKTPQRNIIDPVGLDLATFEHVARQIEEAMENWVQSHLS